MHVFLLFLVCVGAYNAASSEPVFVTYVDSAGINWGAQPPIPVVNAGPTNYTHIYCSFYLPSLHMLTDFAEVAANLNPIYEGVFFVDAMHRAGKKVILSVGGATETPVSPDYFTVNDPLALAATLAALVRNASLDGVDIDFEDDWSNGNPGLTGYGSYRAPGFGPAIPWLVDLTNNLRKLLPSSEGYTISHAPQPAYFALGYKAVHASAGDAIDWYNIQYYNQGTDAYTTYQTLVVQENIPNGGCVSPWDGSLTDVITKQGIPQEKIVVGKIVGEGDGNNGWIDVVTFAGILQQARLLFPKLGGVMGWQWGSDVAGVWVSTVSKVF